MGERISIHVCTKDRHSEIACLLTSLRFQSYQEWDLVLIDESQTPLSRHIPTMHLLSRIKQEGHKVRFIDHRQSEGVCRARNTCIKEDVFKNPFICRLDDDVIIERDYLTSLMLVIKEHGYDMASGVTPLMSQPKIEREASRLGDTINKIKFDDDGNITEFGDDCGMCYMTEKNYVFPADHFRSCALYKSEIHDKIMYETNLSPVGFREESFFSLRMKIEGYKIGVDIAAKAWHFVTPSGGCRYPNYQELVKQDDETFRRWAKRLYATHKNKLK